MEIAELGYEEQGQSAKTVIAPVDYPPRQMDQKGPDEDGDYLRPTKGIGEQEGEVRKLVWGQTHHPGGLKWIPLVSDYKVYWPASEDMVRRNNPEIEEWDRRGSTNWFPIVQSVHCQKM